MNRTIRTTAAALGVGALLAGGLAAGQAFGAPSDSASPTVAGQAFGLGNADGRGYGARMGTNGYSNSTHAGNAYGYRTATDPTTTATATASDELAEDLAFSREEERLARDLYAAIADLYDGARPFSMITNSEQRHYDAVGTLLDRYGLEDPSDGLSAGTYADPTLQSLYDAWWTRAQVSIEDAYQVGIELEQRDIADLKEMLAADYPSDVESVFSNLLQGSENHLAAYQRAADGDLEPGTGVGMMNGNGRMGGAGYGPGTGDCPYADET